MIKLDTVESAFGTITVFKKKTTGAITYEQGGCCQSEADRYRIQAGDNEISRLETVMTMTQQLQCFKWLSGVALRPHRARLGMGSRSEAIAGFFGAVR